MADDQKGTTGQHLPAAQFTNLAQVSHTNHEFFFDFAQTIGRLARSKDQIPLIEAQLVARLVMTPQHAKQLLAALQDSVRMYEEKYGAIQVHDAKAPPGELN